MWSKNTLPREPDLNDPRYQKAQGAINFTHNEFENFHNVYDNWPIDDPYRDTALCIVTAVKSVGGKPVQEALDNLSGNERKELIEVMSAVVELRMPPPLDQNRSIALTPEINARLHNSMLTRGLTPHQEVTPMAKKTLSVENIGVVAETPSTESDNLYEHLPTLTREDALRVISEQHLHRAWTMWGDGNQNERLTINDRIAGTVHQVFDILQNGIEGTLPAFDLVPVDTDPKEIQPEPYLDHGDGQGSGPYQWSPDPLYLAPQGVDAVSLTSAFESVYDHYKDRLAAAARDLFR